MGELMEESKPTVFEKPEKRKAKSPDDASGTAHNMGVSRILQEARKSESPDKLRNRLRRVQRKLKDME